MLSPCQGLQMCWPVLRLVWNTWATVRRARCQDANGSNKHSNRIGSIENEPCPSEAGNKGLPALKALSEEGLNAAAHKVRVRVD